LLAKQQDLFLLCPRSKVEPLQQKNTNFRNTEGAVNSKDTMQLPWFQDPSNEYWDLPQLSRCGGMRPACQHMIQPQFSTKMNAVKEPG
jgi:hypothetical protein